MAFLNSKRAACVFASLGISMSAHGAGLPSYPVRLEQVAQTLFAAHPELAGDAVDLPAAIVARDQEPALQAGPVERWAGNSLAHVRFRCKSEGVCLPFYATVHVGAAEVKPSPASGLKPSVHEEHSIAPEPILRAGSRAIMLIDSGRLHLKLPVRCLGSGGVGSSIRVAGQEHGRIYQVAVLDGSTVRGTL